MQKTNLSALELRKLHIYAIISKYFSISFVWRHKFVEFFYFAILRYCITWFSHTFRAQCLMWKFFPEWINFRSNKRFFWSWGFKWSFFESNKILGMTAIKQMRSTSDDTFFCSNSFLCSVWQSPKQFSFIHSVFPTGQKLKWCPRTQKLSQFPQPI